MTQETVERIIDETVDTIIDSIDESTVDYMFEYGDYEETDNQFLEDLKVFKTEVVKELYNRIKLEIMSELKSKRFVVRKSLVGKNQVINVTFKNGNTVTYNHDKVFEIMKDKLESMNCWEKYKSYTCSNNIPVVLRDKEIV